MHLFLFAAGLVSGCATPLLRPQEVQVVGARQIAMEARVQLQNKLEKKTYTLVLEAIAIEPSRLRLDLTGPFGAPMGKLVMREDSIGILAPQQKKAYFGSVSENSFRPLFPLNLHPRDLLQFILGEAPKNWRCESKSETLEVCHDPLDQLILERDPTKDGRQKKWSVASSDFSMTVLPLNIQTNVQVKPDTFSLPIPQGYSKHKLP